MRENEIVGNSHLPTVWFDLDGVMADFEHGAIDFLHSLARQLSKEKQEEVIEAIFDLSNGSVFVDPNNVDLEKFDISDLKINRVDFNHPNHDEDRYVFSQIFQVLMNAIRGDSDIKKKMYKGFQFNENFWVSLPVYSDRSGNSLELWKLAHKLKAEGKIKEVKVLTGTMGGKSNSGKRLWVASNLSPTPDDSNVFTVSGGTKYKLLKDGRANKGDILIDDRDKELIPWRENGGIGLKFITVSQSMGSLRRLINEKR